jgi:transcriptional regulator with XRE-family HTH domain
MRVAIRSRAHAAFGHAVRDVRYERRLSQEGLALECGLDRTYVSGIERGVRNPSLANIFKLASALDVSPVELFARAEAVATDPKVQVARPKSKAAAKS